MTAPPSGPWGVKRLWIVEEPGLKLAPGFASYLSRSRWCERPSYEHQVRSIWRIGDSETTKFATALYIRRRSDQDHSCAARVRTRRE